MCWVCVCVLVCGCAFFVFFVRGSSCLGLLVYLLARSGVFWIPVLGFGGALGFVLRALRVPWVALGVLGGRFGRPGGPQSNFLTFFLLILSL